MSTLEKVKDVIERQIKPALMADGGNIEFVGLEDGEVKVRLSGACAGCPMRQFTLVSFIESTIKKEVPEIKKVVAV